MLDSVGANVYGWLKTMGQAPLLSQLLFLDCQDLVSILFPTFCCLVSFYWGGRDVDGAIHSPKRIATQCRRNRSHASEICQAAAAKKSIITNRCHTLRNHNARQAAATRKSPITYWCHTLWDHNARQAAAIRKSPFSNWCHTLRYHNARQAAAILKSIPANWCHTLWNLYCR